MDKKINRIASFDVDHQKLEPGIYISRVDGDITTYDMRTRKPNTGDLMSNSAMHSFEHMFATYIRNSEISQDVIYFGPMGCQTGFYLLVRNADNNNVLGVVKTVLENIINHEGEIFGKSAVECGNYINLELSAAQTEAVNYLKLLNSYEPDFKY